VVVSDGAKVNAADHAHADIRAAIIRGDFAPGSMLSESTLAASLSMSRTPVRTALGRLQDEGFITIYPQRGALVRELTNDEVRESAQVRHALECAGVQLADARARAGLGERLADNLDAQQQALRSGDFPGFATLAMQFHRAFVELTNNSIMLSYYDRLRDRQYLSILRSAPMVTEEPARIMDEHRTLLAEAQGGDWVAFSAVLRRHQNHTHQLE
jgi:DNA-binding GntR family transcriptional regulator